MNLHPYRHRLADGYDVTILKCLNRSGTSSAVTGCRYRLKPPRPVPKTGDRPVVGRRPPRECPTTVANRRVGKLLPAIAGGERPDTHDGQPDNDERGKPAPVDAAHDSPVTQGDRRAGNYEKQRQQLSQLRDVDRGADQDYGRSDEDREPQGRRPGSGA